MNFPPGARRLLCLLLGGFAGLGGHRGFSTALAGSSTGKGSDFLSRDSSPASLNESSRDSSPELFPSREPSPLGLGEELHPALSRSPASESISFDEGTRALLRYLYRDRFFPGIFDGETPRGALERLWSWRLPVLEPQFFSSSSTGGALWQQLRTVNSPPRGGFASTVETLLPRPLRWLGRALDITRELPRRWSQGLAEGVLGDLPFGSFSWPRGWGQLLPMLPTGIYQPLVLLTLLALTFALSRGRRLLPLALALRGGGLPREASQPSQLVPAASHPRFPTVLRSGRF